jgi:hypothetical protein
MGLPGRQGSVRLMNFEPMFVDSQSPDFLSFRFSGQHGDWQRPLGRVGGTGRFGKGPSLFWWESPAACSYVCLFRCRNPARLWMYGITGQDPQCSWSPSPDDGPVLVTVEYKIDPVKAQQFLEAIHKYQRIRRRDGATRWGIYYDSESPGIYVETFLVDSWAEHQRQHDRFTVADRTVEEQVFRFAREPVRVRHFIYARTSRRK